MYREWVEDRIVFWWHSALGVDFLARNVIMTLESHFRSVLVNHIVMYINFSEWKQSEKLV